MNRYVAILTEVMISLAMTATLASCNVDLTPTLQLSKTVTLEYDETYDFSSKGCKGFSLSYDLPGHCIVSTGDVDEPEISFDFKFQGLSKSKLKEQYDNIKVTQVISEDNILCVEVVDGTTGFEARSYRAWLDGDSNIIFKNTTATVNITLPRSFNFCSISSFESDITAKGLGGSVSLFSYKSITAEGIAFDSSDNLIHSDGDITISTARYNNSRANVYVSGESITYVFPEPSQMTERRSADTIEMLADNITIDLNGNTYTDVMYFDGKKHLYHHMVGDAAVFKIITRSDDFDIINGEHIIKNEQ